MDRRKITTNSGKQQNAAIKEIRFYIKVNKKKVYTFNPVCLSGRVHSKTKTEVFLQKRKTIEAERDEIPRNKLAGNKNGQ